MALSKEQQDLKRLEILEQLTTLKRIDKTHNDLWAFVQVYLKHYLQNTTPEFHKEIYKDLTNLFLPPRHPASPQDTMRLESMSGEKITLSPPSLLSLPNPKLSPPIPLQQEKILSNGNHIPSVIDPLPPRNLENGEDDTLSISGNDTTLKANVDRFYTRQLIVAPRGFAKSTLTSRFLPLWLAITGRAKDIFLVSATVSLAKEHLRIIRQELEANLELIHDFGYQPSDKWTEEHILLKNGANIRAKGRGFQIRGFRPDVIICDDLEDEEVIYSKDQREKMETWFFRTLLPALKPFQRLIYVGTILHPFSLINKLRQKEEFKKKEFKALQNDVSIWEELFPTTYLNNLRKEIGEYAFQAEYMNNPLSMENQPIKPEYLDVKPSNEERLVRVMAVDPAISEKEVADYSAITIFERTKDNRFRLIAKTRGHFGIDVLVERIISLYQRYKPDRVLLEEFAYQKVIRSILTEKAREQDIFIPISTAEVGRSNTIDKRPMDKLTRLLQVLPLFEQRLVDIQDEDIRQELFAFPFGDHDDLVDATVYALYWLMKYQKAANTFQKEGKLVVDVKPSLSLHEKNGVWYGTHEPPVFPGHPNKFINTAKK